jgi:hypothetical protein
VVFAAKSKLSKSKMCVQCLCLNKFQMRTRSLVPALLLLIVATTNTAVTVIDSHNVTRESLVSGAWHSPNPIYSCCPSQVRKETWYQIVVVVTVLLFFCRQQILSSSLLLSLGRSRWHSRSRRRCIPRVGRATAVYRCCHGCSPCGRNAVSVELKLWW